MATSSRALVARARALLLQRIIRRVVLRRVVAIGALLRNTPGQHAIPDMTIEDNALGLSVELTRRTGAAPLLWPPGASLDLVLEISLDSGTTWQPLAGLSAEGGGIQDRLAQDVPATNLFVELPDGIGRIVRGTLTVRGAAVRTQVAMQTEV